VAFSNKLVRHFNFHNYDSLVAHSDKYDPRGDSAALTSDTTYAANAAAATGDLNELKRLVASGLSINRADYDGRTPLHLAASEGRERVARFLLRRRADPTAQDRWGNRPWQDAEAHGYPDLAKLLKEACEDTGEDTLPAQTAAEATAHVPSAGSMAPLPSGVKDSDVVGVDEEGEPEAMDDLDEDAPPRTGTHG
jgi:ankyrin repeat protein